MGDREITFELATALYNERIRIAGLYSEQIVLLGDMIFRARVSEKDVRNLINNLSSILESLEHIAFKGMPPTYRTLGEEREQERIKKMAWGDINIEAIPLNGYVCASYDANGLKLDIQKMAGIQDQLKIESHMLMHAKLMSLSREERYKIFSSFLHVIDDLKAALFFYTLGGDLSKWERCLRESLCINFDEITTPQIDMAIDKIEFVVPERNIFWVFEKGRERYLVEEAICLYNDYQILTEVFASYKKGMISYCLENEYKVIQKLIKIIEPIINNNPKISSILNTT